MCLICVDFQKQLLTPLEARRILSEMVPDMEPKHFREVMDMIVEAEENESGDSSH